MPPTAFPDTERPQSKCWQVMAASGSAGSGVTTNPPLGAAGQSCATPAAGSCCGTPAAKGGSPRRPPVLCAGQRAAGMALRTLAAAGSLSQPTPHGARSRALCGRALCSSTREAPEPRAKRTEQALHPSGTACSSCQLPGEPPALGAISTCRALSPRSCSPAITRNS